MISHYIGNCSQNNLPLRHTLMTLLPYKALTTLICFQKPLRLHIGERSKIFLPTPAFFQRPHLSTLKRPKTNQTCISYKAMFLSIKMNTMIFKKVTKRLIFGRNAKERGFVSDWRLKRSRNTSGTKRGKKTLNTTLQ